MNHPHDKEPASVQPATQPSQTDREADIAAIRHTLMTGLSHNAAIAALDRLAALSSMTPGYLPHEEGTT